MAVDSFLDTNILVYAYDRDAPAKRKIAVGIVEDGWNQPGSVAISVQVLQELYVNLNRRGVPREESAVIVGDLTLWPVVENTLDLLGSAFGEQVRWKISFWDALIVAAARAAGASELVTEDLNHGQDYGGIRSTNPFR